MTQAEKREYLITELLKELPEYESIKIPTNEMEQKKLLRSLFNIRMPLPVSDDFITIQNEYLREETRQKGIISLDNLQSIKPDIYLWQGDITTLACDAIVNAANSEMLGCFCPCHGCIDNAIHSAAGIQLRNECAEIMERQGYEEPTGRAKITKGYNLPAKHVIHTVGPIVGVSVTEKQKEQLRSCYLSCMILAERERLQSMAFCCISTGEFHFPNKLAAQIAVETVDRYLTASRLRRVVFNVFKDEDLHIYRNLMR